MTEEAPAPTFDFDESFQLKVAAATIRNEQQFAARTEGLIKPDYFADPVVGSIMAVMQEYYSGYQRMPTTSTIGTVIKDAITNKKLNKELKQEIIDRLGKILKTDIADIGFIQDKVVTFAKHQAMEQAILQSVGYLERREFDKIEEVISKAKLVGAIETDQGYDYFKEIDTRTAVRKEIAAGHVRRDGISTGYPEIDKYLYHNGWGRKELSLLLGAAKSGKSIGLWDVSKNATFIVNDKGRYNSVLGLTCEVSKEILGDRIDANISDTVMNALHVHPNDVATKIKAAEAKAGKFLIHEYPSGTLTPSMVRRLLENYRSKGIIFDLVVIDYLDIMAPDHWTDSNIENSKQIFLGARAIGFDFDLAVLSASQLNRIGAKALTGKATDIAEDYNRIRIADVAISINATEEEKGLSEARLYWAASRNTEEGLTLSIRQDRARMKFITKVIGRTT